MKARSCTIHRPKRKKTPEPGGNIKSSLHTPNTDNTAAEPLPESTPAEVQAAFEAAEPPHETFSETHESSLHRESAANNVPWDTDTGDSNHADDTAEPAAPTEETLPESAPTEVQAAFELPPLCAENWVAIVRQLGQLPEISAAQMALAHMAWVDLQPSVLTLAVDRANTTRHTVKPAYVARIAQTLSQHYQSSLHIELVDWEDGHGWETPAMYETRQQNERRAEAVSLMQADSAVQKLQQLFGARWMESSVRLLSDSAS